MKKYLILLLIPLLLHSCGTASKISKADQPWSYETESMGVGADGKYVIRVWSYWRNANMPVEEAKKNAVHAVIFRGVPAGNGATAQPALKTGDLTPAESAFSTLSSSLNTRDTSAPWPQAAYRSSRRAATNIK